MRYPGFPSRFHNRTESEIVGLVPQAALLAAAEYYLQIEGFKSDLVLENRLRQ